MISGLVGFAGRIRAAGGEVGAAELIDAARAIAMVDLAARSEVERVLRLCIAWATVEPDTFAEVFDEWFSGAALLLAADPMNDEVSPSIDVETIPAAAIHTDESMLVPGEEAADGASTEEPGRRAPSGPVTPDADGSAVGGRGDLMAGPPSDEAGEAADGREQIAVTLPVAPDEHDLAMARRAFDRAIEHRGSGVRVVPARRVEATAAPLRRDERVQIDRAVRSLKRSMTGGPSWRRRSAPNGAIDLRRTMRRTVTGGGTPYEIARRGPRSDAAQLVVLVDLSLSVRGTARLVLHLLHRLRSGMGRVRVFGFVDTFAPLDRALRTDDPAQAIERVLSSVDVDATSDPGRAFRLWWSRWHHLVGPETHVIVLSDGRCNGRDPAFEVIRRITQRSASTVWASPEPEGAWRLGRGEMSNYASCVDQAVTVRSLEDLTRLSSSRAGRGTATRDGRSRRDPTPTSV